MPRESHTEEQIVAVLRQMEAGARVAEIRRKLVTCRRMGALPLRAKQYHHLAENAARSGAREPTIHRFRAKHYPYY